jgi:hypothetical protein
MTETEEDLPPSDEREAERWGYQKIGEFIFWFSQIELAMRSRSHKTARPTNGDNRCVV